MADAYQPVTVHVPAERLAEFYQFFGAWLAGEPISETRPRGDEEDARIMKH